MSEINNIWVEKFLVYMKGIKRSADTTINTYRKNLKYLLDYLKTDDILNITEEQIENYLSTCKEASTFNQNLSTFKSFYKWAKQRDYLGDKPNPAIEIGSVKIKKKEPKYLKENEKNELIDCIINDIRGRFIARDLAIIMLMLNGLRRSEVGKINVKDIIKTEKTYILKIKGAKGNKDRTVILYPEACAAIQDYLNADYRSYYKNAEALFLTLDGKRLSTNAIAKQTKKYLEKINKKDFSCHKLRHTYATLLYQKNHDLLLVANQLGHESISTTQIYTHLDLDTMIDSILEK